MPATYVAWFLLPLAPWLAWGMLRRRGAEFAAVYVIGGLFALLVLGPSELWLFRWPLRLVQYVHLALGVLVAVLVTQGIAVRAGRFKAAWSCGIVTIGGWLAFAGRPDLMGRHLVGTLMVIGLVGVVIAVARRWSPLVPAAMVAGTGVVLALQLAWVPSNHDVMIWRAPTRIEVFEEYAASHPAGVVQIAHADLIPVDQRNAAASELLFGSQPAIAGVESTTSYTGIGFNAFSRTLCLTFSGNSCPAAFPVVWQPAGTAVRTPMLLDAVKARTLVVQHALVPEAAEFTPPQGWRRTRVGDHATVFERTAPLPWPSSRLAAISGDVGVVTADGTASHESVVVRTGTGGGAVQFARLAWPGYRAGLDGRPVEVRENAQGLIEVALPPGVTDGELTLDFSPPGYAIGVPLLLAGVVTAVAMGVMEAAQRRRGRDAVRASSTIA
ncbi:MAG: hypothetical protein IPL36_05990 [Nigerium sp.]|nr:hypothetical protein [Nigerium sp.]